MTDKPDRDIPASREITTFMHCSLCIAEIHQKMEETGEAQSPRLYARNEIGFTKLGIQIWCVRHEVNVVHIDFQGIQHPANMLTEAQEAQLELANKGVKP